MRSNIQGIKQNEEFFIYDYQNEFDLIQYENLFIKNGIADKSQDRLNWQHLNNPCNSTFISFAIEQLTKKYAALYTVFPVHFKYFKTTLQAAQSIDTITDYNYRGKGLFILLAKHLYNKASEKGVEFVYGFPNKNSVTGFLQKLNWIEIADVPFLIKPLRPKYFLNLIPILKNFTSIFPNISLFFKIKTRTLKDYQIKSITSFDQSVDEVWKKFAERINIAVDRNQSYLNWRITQKPKEGYITYGLYTNEQKLCAIISYSIKNKHTGKIGYIMDYYFDYNHEKAADNLLKKVIDEMNSKKVDAILTWCFKHSPNYSHYIKSRFYYLPKKLRPIELHFGALDLSKKNNAISKKENWYISYLDSDTV